ncbi:hypothetical protein GC163_13880 [bacterium]|nr:hypothetical protein [bacterium]
MVRFGLLLAALFVMAPLTASAQVAEVSYSVTFFSTDGTFEGVIQFFEDEDGADDEFEEGACDISVGPDAPDVYGTYTSETTGFGPNKMTTVEFKGKDEDGARVTFSATVDGKKISGNGRTGNGTIFFIRGREIR